MSEGSHRPAVSTAIEERDWPRALELLRAADREGTLDARELVLLAECARWNGRSELGLDALERAHAAFAAAEDAEEAARTALELVQVHLDLGRSAVAASWCARAEELLKDRPVGPAHGLLAWHQARAASDRGQMDVQEEFARRAHEIACAHGDRNLEALALLELGHVSAARGKTSAALDAFDQATALALGGEIGLFESGMVFCNAIFACRSRGEWDRAFEWTDSATRWVERKKIGYFPGLCRVHRSEVLRIRGRLEEAEQEAVEAVRLLEESIPRWTTMALGELGEVRRRRGDLAGAMEAFHRALGLGLDPEPGLALCLAAQGDSAAAHRTLDRVFRAKRPTLLCQDRTNLLLARVAIAVDVDELELAENGVEELEALAEREGRPWDQAIAALARGLLELGRGDAAAAVDALLVARSGWSDLDAPYELATSAAALGRALLLDGDEPGARLALESARSTFERIAASRDARAVARTLAELSAPEPQASGGTSQPQVRSAELRREGDVWALGLDGRLLRLRDSRGMQYLATLLERPGAEHAALVLASGMDAEGDRRAIVDRGDAGVLLDDQARAAIRRRIAELEEELEEAREHHDDGRMETLAEEKEALFRSLAEAVGLAGRARRAPGAAERARQSVTKALRGAVRRIAEEDAALGRHLQACVRTGAICRYAPDPDRPIDWRVAR